MSTATYAYKARDSTGKVRTGTLDADGAVSFSATAPLGGTLTFSVGSTVEEEDPTDNVDVVTFP